MEPNKILMISVALEEYYSLQMSILLNSKHVSWVQEPTTQEELSAFMANGKGIERMQVFGDSLPVIDWIRSANQIQNVTLRPLADHLKKSLVFSKHFFHTFLSRIEQGCRWNIKGGTAGGGRNYYTTGGHA